MSDGSSLSLKAKSQSHITANKGNTMDNTETEPMVMVRQRELGEMIARLVSAEIMVEHRDARIQQLEQQLAEARAQVNA